MSEPSSSITINFFDINGEYREDVKVQPEKNFLLLDCPMRIIDQYINNNFLQDLKKESEDDFIIQYKFTYQIKENIYITINCDIINNFSVSHQCTLYSNAYIVFCNLESKTTLELLEKIVDYIRDNCSIKIKSYIIGVFKDNIDEDKVYLKMNEFLGSFDFEFEYYEMYVGDKDKFQMISKEHENAETMDNIFKNVFKEIYEGGNKLHISIGSVKNNVEDKSMMKCIIY